MGPLRHGRQRARVGLERVRNTPLHPRRGLERPDLPLHGPGRARSVRPQPHTGLPVAPPSSLPSSRRRTSVARPRVPRGESFWRDVVIQWSKDVGRSLDYLEERPDIDRDRLAFHGLSMGADVGPLAAAVDARFRAVVLVAGGLSTEEEPPEVDAFLFAPACHCPRADDQRAARFLRLRWRRRRSLSSVRSGPRTTSSATYIFEGGHVPSALAGGGPGNPRLARPSPGPGELVSLGGLVNRLPVVLATLLVACSAPPPEPAASRAPALPATIVDLTHASTPTRSTGPPKPASSSSRSPTG